MKKAVLIILLSLLGSLSGYYTYQNIGTYLELDHPFQDTIQFKYIYYTVTDRDNNIYCIDHGKKRITKSRNGIVTYVIYAGKSAEGLNYVFSDLAAGDDGSLYVKRITLTPDGTYARREEVIEYAPANPNRNREIYSVDYDDPASRPPAHPGALRYFRYSGGYLYFYIFNGQKDAKGYQLVILQKVSITDPSKKYPVTFHISPDLDLNKVIGINPGMVFCTTKKGEIFKIDLLGGYLKVYPIAVSNTGQVNKPGRTRKPNTLVNAGSLNQPQSVGTNPVYLGLDAQDRLYFSDESERRICRLDFTKAQPYETILLEEVWRNKTHTSEPMIIKFISVNPDGAIIGMICDRIFTMRPHTDGYTIREVTTARYPKAMFWGRCVIWAWPALFCISLIILWICLYRGWIRKRIFVKQILIFVMAMLLLMAAVTYIVFKGFSSSLTDGVIYKLSALIDIGARSLNIGDLEKITTTADFKSDYYNRIQRYLNLIQGSDPDSASFNENLYSTIYKVDKYNGQNIFYICVTDDNYRSPFYPYYLPDKKDRDLYNRAVNNHKPYQFYPYYLPEKKDWNVNNSAANNYKPYQHGLYSTDDIIPFLSSKDVEGDWIFVIRRIFDHQGQVIGLYEIGMGRDQIIRAEKIVLYQLVTICLVLALLCGLAFWIFTQQLLTPVKKLTRGVDNVAGGKFDERINIHSGDEMERLAEGFNSMSSNLKERIERIEHMGNAYARFVPKQFGEFLHVKDMTDIQLGDQAKYEMSVLFSDICSFYRLLKNMTPEESFRFINSFFKTIGPLIPENGGFISDYLDAGLIALFPRKADDALQTALAMRKQLAQYNLYRTQSNYQQIEIGIAIHKCPMILGIVGEENRLEGTVVSEGVALAGTLEKIAFKFGASILVTQDIIQSLTEPGKYQFRYLGLIVLENDKEPTPVYDIFQGDIETIRKAKEETKELFEEGVRLYQAEHFPEAAAKFIDVIKKNNHDEAAKIYFFLCDEFIQKGIPRNWNRSVM